MTYDPDIDIDNKIDAQFGTAFRWNLTVRGMDEPITNPPACSVGEQPFKDSDGNDISPITGSWRRICRDEGRSR